ncbi:MAG TPA: hypothetical protein VIF62_13340 [Labilithrix sp.]|jgi:hypothetical protein
MIREQDIPWGELGLARLDAERRRRFGLAWSSRMNQEHLAVGAFAILTQELAEDGCDPIVLEMIAKASSDEVRHARICRRLAVAALGESEVTPLLRGVPSVPKYADAPRTLRALYHVVEMCCLNETFTGVYLTEMHARATDPAARAAVDSLLADEIGHGRAGWAYLATRKGDPALDALAKELPALVDRSMSAVARAAKQHPEADDPALEAFGWLGSAAATAIYEQTLRDVIMPGFESLGIVIDAR